jgi:hypothetical protein
MIENTLLQTEESDNNKQIIDPNVEEAVTRLEGYRDYIRDIRVESNELNFGDY